MSKWVKALNGPVPHSPTWICTSKCVNGIISLLWTGITAVQEVSWVTCAAGAGHASLLPIRDRWKNWAFHYLCYLPPLGRIRASSSVSGDCDVASTWGPPNLPCLVSNSFGKLKYVYVYCMFRSEANLILLPQLEPENDIDYSSLLSATRHF